MSEFESLRNVTVGQYIPTDSIVHRCEPRAKLLAALFLAFAISSTRSLAATLLGIAMEAQCYSGGKGRTKFVQLHMEPLDWGMIVVTLAVWLAVAFLPWPMLWTVFPQTAP